MERRNDVSTILANLALRRFPVVLEDEERHPQLINARGVTPYAVIRPLGWLYLCLHHADVIGRFDRTKINHILRPLHYRYEPDHQTAIPLR